MKLAAFSLLALLSPMLFAQKNPAPNTLTAEEKAQGWLLLFDGHSMEHWIDPSKLTPPGDAWKIEDECLAAKPHPVITEDLFSQDTYSDFELMWDWKLAKGSNSGLKYRIQLLPVLNKRTHNPNGRRFEDQVNYALENKFLDRSLIQPGEQTQIYVIGFEYQMIDNRGHIDAIRGAKYQTGALYSMIGASEDVSKPIGQFNHSRLVVQGNHVEHWLNGVKVVDAQLDDPEMLKDLEHRWGKGSPVYEQLAKQPRKACHISLQNHDDAAWFRNIKIRVLGK